VSPTRFQVRERRKDLREIKLYKKRIYRKIILTFIALKRRVRNLEIRIILRGSQIACG